MARINLGRVVGKSAYELALDNGFVGSLNDWLLSLIGEQGASAYEVAVSDGFVGSVSEWLLSLHGIDGKSAYEVAVSNGFIGTEEQWLDSLKGADGATDYNDLDNKPDLSVYQTKTDDLLGTISKNVVGAINEVNAKLPVSHSDLEELNGDNNYLHITAAEKARYEAKQSTSEKGAANGYAGLDLDQKIDKSNLNAVDDLGGTIYHSTPWFTPVAGQSVTISADGLTVTLSSGTLFTSAMVGARIIVNGIRRVVGSYTSTSVIGVSYAFPVSMRGVTYTYDKWGVYKRFIYTKNGDNGAVDVAVSGLGIFCAVDLRDNFQVKFSSMEYSGNYSVASTSGINFSPYINALGLDTRITRNSAGVLEINSGTAGVYRDLNLRNLNYTGSLTNTSDIRLKQNIRPVTDGLKKVIDISKTIRHYEFIDQDAYGSGVITSEIAQYLLELGFDGHVKQRAPRNESEGKLFGWEYAQKEIVDQEGNPILDQEGNKTFETVVTKEGDLIYTVDSQALTIYLFPAIVELNDKITAIEERLNKAGL